MGTGAGSRRLSSKAQRHHAKVRSPSSSSPSTSCSPSSSVKKRSQAEEAEFLKNVKRRRPAHEETAKKEDHMYEAKAAFGIAAREGVLSEERSEQLFELEIERKKKEAELEMVQLQVLKMKKELGLIE